MNTFSPELDGWENILSEAESDLQAKRDHSSITAQHKQVLAIANLGSSVFTAQKHLSQRMDDLNANIQKSTDASNKMAKKTFWLTIALVGASVVQAFAAVIAVYFVARGN
jgi:predicted membrane-bound mannosyltransferase